MSFKNKKGDVSWYVIALVLAIVVLVVSLFVVPKIRTSQGQAVELSNACKVAGGTCQQGDKCSSGTAITVISCPSTGDKKNPEPWTCCKA
jgi:uncharacterized protein (UPF0333 family)